MPWKYIGGKKYHTLQTCALVVSKWTSGQIHGPVAYSIELYTHWIDSQVDITDSLGLLKWKKRNPVNAACKQSLTEITYSSFFFISNLVRDNWWNAACLQISH